MKHASYNSAPVTRAVAMTPITEAQCRPAFDTPRVRGPIRDDAELVGLIGDIYDTTMDAALWPAALRKMGGFHRGNGNVLSHLGCIGQALVRLRAHRSGL